MQRVTVFERKGQWFFESPSGTDSVPRTTALEAALAAREHADTFEGVALGYIIRLQSNGTTVAGIVLHMRIF